MKKILTALVTAATLAGAALASSAPAEAYWRGGWGWGLGGFALGAAVGSALAAPYYSPYGYYGYYAPYPSAALRVAPCMERLRLGSCLHLTGQSREPSGGKQLRRFPSENASHLPTVAIFDTQLPPKSSL